MEAMIATQKEKGKKTEKLETQLEAVKVGGAMALPRAVRRRLSFRTESAMSKGR